MNVLIAPNAFKNSLPASDVAEAIKTGLQQSNLNAAYHTFPVGDGGDGTGKLLTQKLEAEEITCYVKDPLGRTVQSVMGFVSSSKTAIIEMASASGLRLLKSKERDPLHASSIGTGELIRIALEKQAKKIILAIGGSATVDGGVGILQVLGVRFLDKNGKDLKGVPETLVDLDRIDTTNADQRMRNCELVILCDVLNPLLGPTGAARVFGPQKGASQEVVEKLESCLKRLADVVKKDLRLDIGSLKHGGAAGGTGAMLHAIFNASLRNGIEYFLDVTRFTDYVKNSDIVITGEGSIDDQTLQGKAPFGVSVKARLENVPVIAVAGQVPLNPSDMLRKHFDVLFSIQRGADSLEESIAVTKENLIRTSCDIGNLLAISRY
jgi:glycerate 2-kinase